MTRPANTRRRNLVVGGAACAWCLVIAGCGGPITDASVAHTSAPDTATVPASAIPDGPASGDETVQAAVGETAGDVGTSAGDAIPEPTVEPVAAAPDKPAPAVENRTFSVVGPNGAQRVGFDDLDLLKVLKMDPVTPDCVEKMPGWLRDLNGKPVRIRGYMKPGLLLTGIPQFMFVRDTGLCCFGPKGKIYDMIAVTLKAGTTTDYIDRLPFDVVGTFRIKLEQLEDDGMIFELYHIDDAAIFRSSK